MRVLFINTTCGQGSHGKICVQLAKEYIAQGHECMIAYGRNSVPDEAASLAIQIGDKLSIYGHVLLTRLLDRHGLGSRQATKRFLQWADEFAPDILWMHNIHGYYLNYPMLFQWIKSRPGMEVKWTLHDCWAFTGHCTNFSACKCEKWKTGCESCIQKKEYPNSFLVDFSKRNYRHKMDAFLGVDNITLYTPSNWLANIVRQSFLGVYPVQVMENPVDHSVFIHRRSSFRENHQLEDKIIVLGVANAWQRSKGLDDFIALAGMLDEKYKIVLVGLTKRQKQGIPPKILGLGKTNNAIELAEIYSSADVFVNPSVEETFGMTSYEAALCETPIVVYAGTACEEVARKYRGYIIEANVTALYEQIMSMGLEKLRK